MQFPDFVHAVKPEPHNEVPTGQSAHNNFWDFFSLQSQTAHTVFWAMSDRGIPRSLRMMQGFGVNTFTLINAKGKRHFVKFHWTPELGVCSLMWDEALKISGQDPDFHRKDLEEAIVNGTYPKWKLGIQVGPRDPILSASSIMKRRPLILNFPSPPPTDRSCPNHGKMNSTLTFSMRQRSGQKNLSPLSTSGN